MDKLRHVWLVVRRTWHVCLPARHLRCAWIPTTGVAVTAALLLLVAVCLFSNSDLEAGAVRDLAVRVMPNKQDDEKKVGEKGAEQRVKEIGPLGKIVDGFKGRSKHLDVRAKQQAFLSIWGVANLIQGALTVVVLVLAARIIIWFTPELCWKEVVWRPIGVLFAIVGLLFVVNTTGIVPLTLDKGLLSHLQNLVEKEAGMRGYVSFLTKIGNVFTALVALLVPVAVGVLLLGSPMSTKRRRERFKALMYSTALLLVVGVIQVTYQSRWAALFFDDETSIQSIAQMAAGAGLLVGAVFTTASGFVFLPAGYLLHRRESAEADPSSAAPSKSWLTEILAILAPVLTALPVAKLFEIVR